MKVTVFPPINLLAVVVAAIVSFVIGAVWYAPPVFGNTFFKLLGRTQEEFRKPGQLAGGIIRTLIIAYVLAVFIGYAGAKTASDGAIIGLWAWLGFLTTTIVGDAQITGAPARLPLINGAFSLVFLLVMGAILGAWPP